MKDYAGVRVQTRLKAPLDINFVSRHASVDNERLHRVCESVNTSEGSELGLHFVSRHMSVDNGVRVQTRLKLPPALHFVSRHASVDNERLRRCESANTSESSA